MNFWVLELVPQLRSIDLNLLWLPAHQITHVKQSARQVIRRRKMLKLSHLFHLRISRPGAKWRLSLR